jgi:Amino acid:DNA transferase
MSRDYTPLSTIQEFGSHLLLTGDLDPLYIALYNLHLDRFKLRRWLFAYWCCYHAGASSYLSEKTGTTYWTELHRMAANLESCPIGGRWPRGHERRHFRGKKAVEAVEAYQSRFPQPEELVIWIEKVGPRFSDIRKRILELPQFGPWIAFKVADMLERVAEVSVDFNRSDVLMFEQPYKSALEIADHYELERTSDDEAVRRVCDILLAHFGSRNHAPPRNDRPVNIQEVETILCKWKSHRNGSYPLGNDSKEISHGLRQWSEVSMTAAQLWLKTPGHAS